MLTNKEKMTNLQDAETIITVGDNVILTGKYIAIGTDIGNITEKYIP